MTTTDVRLPHASTAWFEMVGTAMCDAVLQAGLSSDLNLSIVELYTDGADLGGGLRQGLRFDIASGKPSFRVGVRPDEQGDIRIDVTTAGSREVNMLHSDDPAYPAAVGRLMSAGEMKIEGDLSLLKDWIGPVHDVVVDRTR